MIASVNEISLSVPLLDNNAAKSNVVPIPVSLSELSGQILRGNRWAVTENGCMFNHVSQLANISRPAVLLQQLLVYLRQSFKYFAGQCRAGRQARPIQEAPGRLRGPFSRCLRSREGVDFFLFR